jgi:diguanylate cyclase (GGDEF)-like protein
MSRTRHPLLRLAAPRAVLPAAALLVAVLAAAEAVAGVSGLTALGGALAAVAGAVVLTRRLPDATVEERELWQWIGRACWAMALGLTLEATAAFVLVGLAEEWHQGAGLTVGAVLACVLAYQGLVRWNRYRTTVVDRGDLLNAVSWALCGVALVLFVLHHVRAAVAGPGWALEGHVIRAVALLILTGTTLTVTLLSGLRRDARAWTLAAGLAAMTVVEALGARSVLAGEATPDADAVPVVLAWTAVVLVAAWASLLPAATDAVPYASSQVLTVGSLLVIVSGAGVLLGSAFVPGAPRVVPVLAAVGVLGACVRVFRTTREIAQLASSRVEARTDPLTGVANRRAFLEAVARFGAAPRGAALLVVDLDRFEEVNDRYGHSAGDVVIRTTADRLQVELAGRGVLARLGGDEFAVVLDRPGVDRASGIATAMHAAVQVPIDVDGRIVRIGASIGVSSTVLGEAGQGELLRWADAAMYSAKQAGGGVRVYDQAVDAHDRDQRLLADHLRAMLTEDGDEHGAVVLHFQPQLDCVDGAVVGMEALARWDHPERGVLPPAAFIDLAEQHGVMFALTTRVLDQASRQAAVWNHQGRYLPVAVNLSTSCLEHPRLLEVLDDVLRRTDLPADRLVVEVTETTLMHDPAHAVAVTRAIADRGVGVSIDDYGSGYSSLTYLNELPARELKLDRSFTARLTSDERTRAIVSGTVDLAHHLGLRLIAEGVEDASTSEALRSMGCDRTQGYLHSRPLPAADVTAWLREQDAAGRVRPGPPLAAGVVPAQRGGS